MKPVQSVVNAGMRVVEGGWLPDAPIRWAIRRLCAQRLKTERRSRGRLEQQEAIAAFVDALGRTEIAAVPEKANAQHYAVPPELFQLMLGPRLKYSCCWWDPAVRSLAEAEDASLARTAAYADLGDGMDILELGCGWGSLSLWMAERYPRGRIVAVSNSVSQRRFIEAEVRRRQLTNLTVVTADMNVFSTPERYDRVVSVEMLEHMRNYHVLLERIATWLRPNGQLFIHVFCHRELAYFFEEEGAGNWMGRHFFSGGLMPSADLLPSVPSGFTLDAQWQWDGRHYARTARAWLNNLDARRAEALEVLARAPNGGDPHIQFGRWRLFLMACEELFGFEGGREWGVAHYRFLKTAQSQVGLAS
jgi:cyclopropane-fatty-acyl-phospholipid synthase